MRNTPKPKPRRMVRVAGQRARQRAGGRTEQTKRADKPHAQPLPRGLAALAAVLTALGCWFAIGFSEAGGASLRNRALVDTGTTAQVSTEVQQALEQTFSYRFDDPAPTDQAAKDSFAGDAVGQYDRLFSSVHEQAPAQRIVLRSKVASAAVRELDGDRAVLLVFLDQSATRGDTGTSTAGAAQLRVTAQRIKDRWRIVDLRAY